MDVKVRSEGCYRFGRFVLSSAKRELLRDGLPVTLTHRLFETLLVFLSNPDRILTKDELLERERVMIESLIAFKRAGASGILAYFARDAAKALRGA